ncbi:hypothetical protein A3I48_02330 [Candidatus Daviesbacteria bacterium RIFCSPLOWO2_02_FULL_36_7]|uniref:Polymerase nucleotidyl transferase domain-containing protein n=1 Tax=Candidatus Daviesbacteria bacterium RIFCSPLOWO2_02_FULL_36_7 TaxID=1797792 RepID=A0A1F5MGJ4_9BACT|nr:MAG: hypothetical protein A3I48_02330 [Candidatus Daviesbacteria bacterium RIFCSPLOWO2_02_FULL_36_7]
MEKAVLKTLIYADIFDYPLTVFEIHKWLISKKATLRQTVTAVNRLSKKSKVESKKECYFLPKKTSIVNSRLIKTRQSQIYIKNAQMLSQILKVIPWIKLVGISGGLAMENAGKKDDIDLFIVTGKNRLWISRLFILGLLSLTGQRRKRAGKIAGKLCVNILLEEDKLEQTNKDIFVAHEVLQMKVLWQRDGIYSKYLAMNSWAFKFLPNWIGLSSALQNEGDRLSRYNRGTRVDRLVTTFENLAGWFQFKIMQKPRGLERIEDGALYFHPEDCREKVLQKYRFNIGELI